jgi:hypothetical protein
MKIIKIEHIKQHHPLNDIIELTVDRKIEDRWVIRRNCLGYAYYLRVKGLNEGIRN